MKIWENDTNACFDVIKNKVSEVTEPIRRDLELNTIKHIPIEFGKFLYSCLGEKVNTRRVSVINQTYIDKSTHGKMITEKAKEKKCSIQEYLTSHNYYTYNNEKIFNPTQAYILTGKQFGIACSNSKGDGINVTYVEADAIFKFLTQEHVDCINDKEKKECAQAFLDYRNSFISELDTLDTDNIININVPVKIASIITLSSTDKYNSDRYTNNRDTACVIKEVKDDIANVVTITTPTFAIWDKVMEFSNNTARATFDLNPCFSVLFGKVMENLDQCKYKYTICMGNVDIGTTVVSSTIDSLNNSSNDYVMRIPETQRFDSFGKIINKAVNNFDSYKAMQVSKDVNGLIMNLDDIINHPDVQSAIQKRVTFFKDKSKELQELKHKHAGLFFLNEG